MSWAPLPDSFTPINENKPPHHNTRETIILDSNSINITKSPFIPEHENRFSPLVSMDTEAEDITEIGDTTFIEVQRSTKPKASEEAIDLTSHTTAKSISSNVHQRDFPNKENLKIKNSNFKSPKIDENVGSVVSLSDSMLRGIKPMRLSREHYINKQCISGGKINEIKEAVRNMDETTPYRKVLLHVGTNNILKDDQQTILKEIKILVELIKKKWPTEVIYSGIILHKNDIRRNIKINKVSDEIRQKSDEWNIQFLNNTNLVTLPTGHIDPEEYFDNLHLNNEKGPKKTF